MRAVAYISRRRGFHPRPRLLRTAELNAAGWGGGLASALPVKLALGQRQNSASRVPWQGAGGPAGRGQTSRER